MMSLKKNVTFGDIDLSLLVVKINKVQVAYVNKVLRMVGENDEFKIRFYCLK